MKVLREYQKNMKDRILSDIDSGKDKIVMAMCPNSGKTFTAIKLMEDLLRSGTSKKILVLAHGTTVLRSQFYDSLVEEQPSFSYKKITPQARSTKAQVLIALPQGLDRLDLSGVDTVIVDEAHERYLAAGSQRLMKNIKPKCTILLTGTPSKFIYENHRKPGRFKIHMVAMSDIDAEYMANTQVYVCSSKYDIKEEDYNQNEEVGSAFRFKKADTEKTIELFLERVHKLLKMKYISQIDNILPMSFSKLDKTMFACRSQQQARQVYNYLVKNGVNTLVSTEDTDKDSDNIKTFVQDPEVKVLVVVNRGILGFNLPTLVNVVDMSSTRNLDRMYQLFSRVTRTHTDIKYKRYFKMAPAEEVEYMQYVTSAMLALIHRDNISIYNGKNFKTDIPVLVKKASRKSESKSKSKSKSKSVAKLHKFEGIDVIDVFTKIYSNLDKTLQVYSKSSLGEVRKALGFNNSLPGGYWTEERVVEESRKSSSIEDFRYPSESAYKSGRRLGILDKLYEINGWKKRNRPSKEEVIELSKSFPRVTEFKNKYSRHYDAAQHGGYLEELYTINKWKTRKKLKRSEIVYEDVLQFAKGHNLINLKGFQKVKGGHTYSMWLLDNKEEEARLIKDMNWNKHTVRKVKCLETGVVYKTQTQAAKELGIKSTDSIANVLKGRQRSTKGYTFEYVKESEDEDN